MDDILVDVTGVTKDFNVGKIVVNALRGLDLEIRKGDFLAIVGPSGSGKTTLLNLIGALDTPTGGTVEVFGQDLSKLGRRRRAELRLRSLGFVFQAYNLVPVLTALENVEFVLELQGEDSGRSATAMSVLEDLSLGDLAGRRPNELSGGQQQRVAVARAVASKPKLVLADEPTANLDSENAEALLQMMRRLRDEHDMTFVFSTHDPLVVSYASRVVTLRDGKVVSDERKDPGDGHGAAKRGDGRAGMERRVN
jgi:putative ABC transport system ATP-binding protein